MKRFKAGSALPAFFGFLLLLALPSTLFAADDFRELDERLDRAPFNAYVENLIRRERAVPARWFFSGAARYGYDDDVTLNSARVRDAFREYSGVAGASVPHGGLGFFGPGAIGVEPGGFYHDDDTQQALDYFRVDVRPYVTAGFAGGRLDLGYDPEWLSYVHNGGLGYVRHRVTTGLRWKINDALSHRPYFSYSVKQYLRRKSVTSTAALRDERREDGSFEIGHELYLAVNPSLRVGASYAWERNDSNDLFQDFNDFDRYVVNGFAEWLVCRNVRAVLKGGYDRKNYDSRLVPGTDETEADDYFYGSSELYFRLTAQSQLGVTYLYGQNDSNHPAQNYSFSNWTVGLYVDF